MASRHTESTSKLWSSAYDSKALPDGKGELCGQILGLFSELHSVMLMASVVHSVLFGPESSELFSGALVKHMAHGSGDKGSSAQGVLAYEHAIGALGALRGALDNTALVLTGDIATIDLEQYKLCRSMTFCRNWVAQMFAYLAGCQMEFFRCGSKRLQSLTEDLESSLPRWRSLFPGGQPIDWDLVVARILNHPKRQQVPHMVKRIRTLSAELQRCQDAWGCGAAIDNGILSFIADTSATAECYLLIAAGVNTLVHQSKTASYCRMAQEVLDISAKKADGSGLPDTLKLALQRASAGEQVVAQAKEGAATEAVAAKSEPPAKRAKTEAAAPAASSSGAASGGVPPADSERSSESAAPRGHGPMAKAAKSSAASTRPKREARASRRTT